MKKVYFVRHGETVGNVQGYSQLPDTELSDKGHKGAETLAQRFSHIAVDALIASPYVRAQQTAGYLETALGLSVETYDVIHEILRPNAVRGKLVDEELERVYKQYFEQYWETEPRLEGMENVHSVLERVAQTLSFLERKDSSTILVISHGDFIRNLITRVLVKDIDSMHGYRAVYDSFKRMNNVAINELVLKDNAWQVASYNDHAHFAE